MPWLSRSLVARWLWLAAAILVLARLALVADLGVVVTYAPHDDSLYVTRALALLGGSGFGPYDSRILVKFPGLSLWLAMEHRLGIPHFVLLHALYAGAGAYFLAALRSVGVPALVSLAGFALYLFNPYSFSVEWHRILREPIATPLLLVLLAAAVFVIRAASAGRTAYAQLLFFSATLAFASLLREEDPLLLVILLAMAASALAFASRRGAGQRLRWRGWIVIALLPAACVWGAGWATRSFIERHYGERIMHDYGEGEFPKLVAAFRSIRTAKDNRYVMITQEALRGLRAEVPRFAPVVDRLPPPGPASYSCSWLGVCSEWSTGWFLFWIKDAAFQAGLTPSLPEAQAYFRAVREDIERACSDGRFRCVRNGNGVIPPPELRWTRAYLAELRRMTAMLFPRGFESGDQSAIPPTAPPPLARAFATLTHAESASYFGSWAPGAKAALSGAREWVAWAYSLLANIVVGAAVVAFTLALMRGFARRQPVVGMALGITLLYVFVRIAALAYVAVYMGHYEPRMIFTAYAAMLFVAPVMIWAMFRARSKLE
ncbi:MAG: hypothetical protein WAO95_01075 [Burkholderiales bacterium]